MEWSTREVDLNTSIKIDDMSFKVIFSDDSHAFGTKFENVSVVKPREYDEYDGVTDVIPKTTAQTLNTKDKLVRDDITVREIPFEGVENSSGGYTATIGGY